jgi:hypothetical protein
MRKPSKTGSYGNRTTFSRKLNSKVRRCAILGQIRLVPIEGSRVELIIDDVSHGPFDDASAAPTQASALKIVRTVPSSKAKPRSERTYDPTPIRGSDHVGLYIDGKFEDVFSSATAAGAYVADRCRMNRPLMPRSIQSALRAHF